MERAVATAYAELVAPWDYNDDLSFVFCQCATSQERSARRGAVVPDLVRHGECRRLPATQTNFRNAG